MSDSQDKPEQEINQSQNMPVKNNIVTFYIKLAIIGISLYIILVLGVFISTGVREARNNIRREEIKQNLTQIGIALQQYASDQAKQEAKTK